MCTISMGNTLSQYMQSDVSSTFQFFEPAMKITFQNKGNQVSFLLLVADIFVVVTFLVMWSPELDFALQFFFYSSLCSSFCLRSDKKKNDTQTQDKHSKKEFEDFAASIRKRFWSMA